MNGSGFDTLARRMGSTRSSRRVLLRGWAALALGAWLGSGLAGANGTKKSRKKPVCLCPTAAAARCRTVLVPATKAKQQAKKACNYRGRCHRDRVVARCIPPCAQSGGACVFATSTTHNGNLGGLAGADGICQRLAEGAGLPGTYQAWLSDSTASPNTRFMPSSGPYRLVDGTTVANDWADLTTCEATAPFACLVHPIDRDETGAARTGYVWSNTRTDGGAVASTLDCQGWSSNELELTGLGNVESSDRHWTEGASGACSESHRLSCFQQR